MRLAREMDDPTTTTMSVGGEPESREHWRARRLRKAIDNRRRQREKGELQVVGGKNGAKTRDAMSLRALQVRMYCRHIFRVCVAVSAKAVYQVLYNLVCVCILTENFTYRVRYWYFKILPVCTTSDFGRYMFTMMASGHMQRYAISHLCHTNQYASEHAGLF